MNELTATFLLLNAALILFLPRRWAPLPILIGACYIPTAAVVQLGPFHFSAIRVLVAAGLARAVVRQERLTGRMNGVDWLMAAWSGWMLISSLFRNDTSAALTFRLGVVYDACGVYFLFRIFCRSLDDVVLLCRASAVLLAPVALEMLYEKLTMHNLFYEAVGSHLDLDVRLGKARAQGPFGHAILAGTIGAVCLPLCIPLWRRYRTTGVIGISSCLIMVVTSTSSGPILSTMAAAGALFMFHHRYRLRFVRWLMISGYIVLDMIMNDPAYFIMARIDLTGGSTGWHRARLIQSAFEHLSEWWLYGTNYTRHWMPTGVYWSGNHTDITSHYLQMGVWAGLPLMLLFIAVLAKGFSSVGRTLGQLRESSPQSLFMFWALGSSLFADAVTFISVSYYDQSIVFLYLVLAAIGSVRSGLPIRATENTMIGPRVSKRFPLTEWEREGN